MIIFFIKILWFNPNIFKIFEHFGIHFQMVDLARAINELTFVE